VVLTDFSDSLDSVQNQPPGWGYPPPQYPPPGAVVYVQAPAPPMLPPGWIRCPYCGFTGVPAHIVKTSGAGIAIFVVLLIFCFPLCWFGLLIRERTGSRCPSCRNVLGRF